MSALRHSILLLMGATTLWSLHVHADEVWRIPADGVSPAVGPLMRIRLMDPQHHRAAALVRRDGEIAVVRGAWDTLMMESMDADRIELAWPLELHRDHGLEAIGLPIDDTMRSGVLDVAGTGVLVGVVDTGIDWNHPDFLGRDGRQRIAWLLDLSLEERMNVHPGIEAHGGALWSAAELEQARAGELVVPSRDDVGHGTHVAGVIGGLGGTFAPGVAPDVDFVVVKANRDQQFAFTEADVLEGVAFVMERAEAMGKPVVINLSLGGHVGPHDGQSDFERQLKALIDRPGCVLVASAGNSGASDIHASGYLVGARVELPIVVPNYERGEGLSSEIYVDLWYTAGLPTTASLVTPDGRRLELLSEGESAMLDLGNGGMVALSHGLAADMRPALRQVLVVMREPDGKALDPGNYTVVLDGGWGRFDAWVALRGRAGARFGGFLDPDLSITVPGTLEGALSVGAWTSRDTWPSRAGTLPESPLTLGIPAPFSGTGPTRDQRPKPDVLAPGYFVVSALAATADPRLNPGSLFANSLREGFDPVLTGGLYASSQGTSAASPFVAGVAALLLEQNPSLEPKALVDLVRASGQRTDKGPEQLWHPRAGFGLVHAATALALGANGGRVALPSATRSDAGLSRDLLHPDSSEGTRLFIVARDDEGYPLASGWSATVAVRMSEGEVEIGHVEPLSAHLASVWIGPGTARGIGSVEVTIDGVVLETSPRLGVATSWSALEVVLLGEGDESVDCSVVSGVRRRRTRPDLVGWCWLMVMGAVLLKGKRDRSGHRLVGLPGLLSRSRPPVPACHG